MKPSGRHAKAVIPAKAGIQLVHLIGFQRNQARELDSGFRRNDGKWDRRNDS